MFTTGSVATIPCREWPGTLSRRYNRPVEFPRALRELRTRRHLSQLDLALRAGTTQRHLSFIESRRSDPGRNMVVRLAEALELPLRERNELLLTAGYAPAYPESSLDDHALAPVRAAIDHILRGHLPYPALVVDGAGDLIAANTAFDLITEGAAAELVGPGRNIYRLALHPDGLAPASATSPNGRATSWPASATWRSCTPSSWGMFPSWSGAPGCSVSQFHSAFSPRTAS